MESDWIITWNITLLVCLNGFVMMLTGGTLHNTPLIIFGVIVFTQLITYLITGLIVVWCKRKEREAIADVPYAHVP